MSSWRDDPEWQDRMRVLARLEAYGHPAKVEDAEFDGAVAVAAYKRTAIAELEANFSDYVWLPQVLAVLGGLTVEGTAAIRPPCAHPRIAEGWGGPPRCLNCGAVFEDSP